MKTERKAHSMTSVLMVLTGADTWTMKDGSPHPTGFWMEEFVRPHKTFSDAGFDVSIATPQGRTPTVDPLSLALEFNHNDQAEVDFQKAYLDSKRSELDNPLVLGDVDTADYDVMFVVGGHGPMQDLAVDPDIGRLMVAILGDQSKILAAVCHGPASFFRLTTLTGSGFSRDASSPHSATRRRPNPRSPGTRRGCSRIASGSLERSTRPNRRGPRTLSPTKTSSPASRTTRRRPRPTP